MKKEYILVIDSGVGGLSTLAKIMQFSPANYIYFADNLHSPYGSQTNEKIFELLKEIIKGLKKIYELKIVVLACNTATTSSIKNLRAEFKDLVFVGTEPAIGLADKMNAKHILALVTPSTARQSRYNQLECMAHGTVRTLSVPCLAMAIESWMMTEKYSKKLVLLKLTMKILNAAQNSDAVVLGCTHYVFLTKFLKQNSSLPVFDGNFGVAKQISKLNLNKNENSRVKFLFSKPEKGIKQKYAKILRQILANKRKLC